MVLAALRRKAQPGTRRREKQTDMKRYIAVLAMLALVLGGTGRALASLATTVIPGGTGTVVTGADPLFSFSYTSNDGTLEAYGTLNGVSNGDGTYTATSDTITVIDPAAGYNTAVGSLIPDPSAPATITSPAGAFNYDDQLLPAQNPLITYSGLLFEVNGQEVNIFSNGPGPGTYQFWDQSGFNDYGNFSLTPAGVPDVPEASTLVLLPGMLAPLAFAVRQRMVKR
jgi:hypothetical protein